MTPIPSFDAGEVELLVSAVQKHFNIYAGPLIRKMRRELQFSVNALDFRADSMYQEADIAIAVILALAQPC